MIGLTDRLIFAVNNYLQELNAQTGEQISTFGVAGKVDLREGLGRSIESIDTIPVRHTGRVFETLSSWVRRRVSCTNRPLVTFVFTTYSAESKCGYSTLFRIPGNTANETWPKMRGNISANNRLGELSWM